ncbi:MAG: caspase family protein [Myxococcota bacterium]
MIGWLALAGLAQAGGVRHALVVGANDGGGVLEPLRFAESDAERFARVLVELGDFDEQLVTVLYRPTRETLRRALAHHATIAKDYDDDLFVLYYSGHADGAGLRLGDDRFFFETLKHYFQAIDAKLRVGVLDACRSGSVTRFKGAAVTESLFGADGATLSGEAWLTASAPDELAQESDSLRGGFFTHYLVSGMRGAADVGDDGVIALDELYTYTYQRVVDVTGRTGAGTQHPYRNWDLDGTGNLGLTDLRNAEALLRLRSEDQGQIGIFRLPEKHQMAEFYKPPGKPMAIAVPPGRYLVRRRHGDETFEAGFMLHEQGKYDLANWGRPVMSFGVSRGDPFAEAFVRESEDFERRNHLDDSPAIAGIASLVVPGAGQLYNDQVFKGFLYFGGASLVLAETIVPEGRGRLFERGFFPMLGASLWGASIADAIYQVHRREAHRPKMGVTLSTSAGYGPGEWPVHFGLSVDVMLRPGLSIGLDRVGVTPSEQGWDGQFASRLMIATEGRRLRPHLLVGLGVRHGQQPGPGTKQVTRTFASAGVGLRYYTVPRYFIEFDGRYEVAGDASGWVGGLGMGIHLGR